MREGPGRAPGGPGPRVAVLGRGPAADRWTILAERAGMLAVATTDPGTAAAAAGPDGLLLEASPDGSPSRRAAAVAVAERLLPPTALLGVVTRRHALRSLASAMARPPRLTALHLVDAPAGRAPAVPLVELVVSADAEVAAAERALWMLDRLGLAPLPCGDGPGRIVDRLSLAVLLDARHLVLHGFATSRAIDRAMRAAGHAVGPLERTGAAAAAERRLIRAIHEALGGAPRFRPPVDPRSCREAGGSPGAHVPRDAAAAELDPAAIVARLELVAIDEAYRIVGEAVAGPEDVDRAMREGAGWAAGPFELAGRHGLRAVVAGLAALGTGPDADDAVADRFAIAPLLWQMATL